MKTCSIQWELLVQSSYSTSEAIVSHCIEHVFNLRPDERAEEKGLEPSRLLSDLLFQIFLECIEVVVQTLLPLLGRDEVLGFVDVTKGLLSTWLVEHETSVILWCHSQSEEEGLESSS